MNKKQILSYIITYVFFLTISSHKLLAQKDKDFEKEIENPNQYNFNKIDFIDSENNEKLSGTLISPKTEYSKIIIIVPGSGKNTKNSHYVLAEEILKNNIAVYRFDDRGVGESEGNINFSVDQIIRDLYYAYTNIKKASNLSQKSIGILGHSLGGIATIDNYQKGLNLDFIVLMSTPFEKYGRFTKSQFPFNSIKKVSAKTVFENIHIPLLFIAGSNDSFLESEKTADLLRSVNNKNIDVRIIDGLNHFLIKGNDNWKETKKYNDLYDMSQKALTEIITWIKNLKLNLNQK
ncbi:alpha/beta hydrolase [Flavobacterium sp. MMS24-S5]|uniref:alpha/beta hydrolase n=1 Tax=Flavobacterium sp. MMS24-S5 TaxID=3416605 RepID=UPI003D07BDF3